MKQNNYFSGEQQAISRQITYLKKRSKRYTMFRVASFLAAALSLYILIQPYPLISAILTFLFVALLIYFAALHHRNGEQLKHY